ncbi:hypothetical protein OAO87_01110 [bacterium]|nr:hypothetical protein [bacterium]
MITYDGECAPRMYGAISVPGAHSLILKTSTYHTTEEIYAVNLQEMPALPTQHKPAVITDDGECVPRMNGAISVPGAHSLILKNGTHHTTGAIYAVNLQERPRFATLASQPRQPDDDAVRPTLSGAISVENGCAGALRHASGLASEPVRVEYGLSSGGAISIENSRTDRDSLKTSSATQLWLNKDQIQDSSIQAKRLAALGQYTSGQPQAARDAQADATSATGATDVTDVTALQGEQLHKGSGAHLHVPLTIGTLGHQCGPLTVARPSGQPNAQLPDSHFTSAALGVTDVTDVTALQDAQLHKGSFANLQAPPTTDAFGYYYGSPIVARVGAQPNAQLPILASAPLDAQLLDLASVNAPPDGESHMPRIHLASDSATPCVLLSSPGATLARLAIGIDVAALFTGRPPGVELRWSDDALAHTLTGAACLVRLRGGAVGDAPGISESLTSRSLTCNHPHSAGPTHASLIMLSEATRTFVRQLSQRSGLTEFARLARCLRRRRTSLQTRTCRPTSIRASRCLRSHFPPTRQAAFSTMGAARCSKLWLSTWHSTPLPRPITCAHSTTSRTCSSHISLCVPNDAPAVGPALGQGKNPVQSLHELAQAEGLRAVETCPDKHAALKTVTLTLAALSIGSKGTDLVGITGNGEGTAFRTARDLAARAVLARVAQVRPSVQAPAHRAALIGPSVPQERVTHSKLTDDEPHIQFHLPAIARQHRQYVGESTMQRLLRASTDVHMFEVFLALCPASISRLLVYDWRQPPAAPHQLSHAWQPALLRTEPRLILPGVSPLILLAGGGAAVVDLVVTGLKLEGVTSLTSLEWEISEELKARNVTAHITAGEVTHTTHLDLNRLGMEHNEDVPRVRVKMCNESDADVQLGVSTAIMSINAPETAIRVTRESHGASLVVIPNTGDRRPTWIHTTKLYPSLTKARNALADLAKPHLIELATTQYNLECALNAIGTAWHQRRFQKWTCGLHQLAKVACGIADRTRDESLQPDRFVELVASIPVMKKATLSTLSALSLYLGKELCIVLAHNCALTGMFYATNFIDHLSSLSPKVVELLVELGIPEQCLADSTEEPLVWLVTYAGEDRFAHADKLTFDMSEMEWSHHSAHRSSRLPNFADRMESVSHGTASLCMTFTIGMPSPPPTSLPPPTPPSVELVRERTWAERDAELRARAVSLSPSPSTDFSGMLPTPSLKIEEPAAEQPSQDATDELANWQARREAQIKVQREDAARQRATMDSMISQLQSLTNMLIEDRNERNAQRDAGANLTVPFASDAPGGRAPTSGTGTPGALRDPMDTPGPQSSGTSRFTYGTGAGAPRDAPYFPPGRTRPAVGLGVTPVRPAASVSGHERALLFVVVHRVDSSRADEESVSVTTDVLATPAFAAWPDAHDASYAAEAVLSMATPLVATLTRLSEDLMVALPGMHCTLDRVDLDHHIDMNGDDLCVATRVTCTVDSSLSPADVLIRLTDDRARAERLRLSELSRVATLARVANAASRAESYAVTIAGQSRELRGLYYATRQLLMSPPLVASADAASHIPRHHGSHDSMYPLATSSGKRLKWRDGPVMDTAGCLPRCTPTMPIEVLHRLIMLCLHTPHSSKIPDVLRERFKTIMQAILAAHAPNPSYAQYLEDAGVSHSMESNLDVIE